MSEVATPLLFTANAVNAHNSGNAEEAFLSAIAAALSSFSTGTNNYLKNIKLSELEVKNAQLREQLSQANQDS